MQIHEAHRLITRQIEIFAFRKATGGDHYEIACKAVSEGNARCLPLLVTPVRGDKEINRGQFYQALC